MSRSGPSRDVAIYAAEAHAFYERKVGPPPHFGGGGAEFQTAQMALRLADSGLETAHIVYPVKNLAETPERLTVVARNAYQGEGGPLAKMREARAIWKSLKEADARVNILRAYGLHLVVGALFSRLHRRPWVMSGSNDLEFMPEKRSGPRAGRLYHWAIQSADSIVTQTSQQLQIAKREFPGVGDFDVIRSFAEPAEPAAGPFEAFLWAGRVVDYKRPLEYAELARALPEARFRMVLVEMPDSPPEMVAALRAAGEELDNLEILDAMPRAGILDLMERTTAVVVTSEHEGMPNVFLEAWAREIPVLTLSFDPDERVSNDGLGISAAGSREAFVEGARRLWGDPDLRRQMGARGRDYIARNHYPEVIGSKWAAKLAPLLEGR